MALLTVKHVSKYADEKIFSVYSNGITVKFKKTNHMVSLHCYLHNDQRSY